MADIVVDGFENLDIPQVITAYDVDEVTGEVSITTDGDSSLVITEVVDGDVSVYNDGEAGIVTEIRGGDYPYYTGNYEVTPTMELQTLNTKDKVLTNNVKIKKIPIYEIENDKGGTTVYIAMEATE